MQIRDIRGLTLTGATQEALPHYEQAVAELLCYRADPVASLDRAMAAARIACARCAPRPRGAARWNSNGTTPGLGTRWRI